MVGPALASITPILLSLFLPDPFPRTFEIIACFVVIQILESNVLGPRIVGHAVGLHPVAAILALLVGAKLFGVFGAFLSTPIVAAAWVVIASLYSSIRGESPDDLLAKRRSNWPLRPNLSGFIGARTRPPHTDARGPGSSGGVKKENETRIDEGDAASTDSTAPAQQDVLVNDSNAAPSD